MSDCPTVEQLQKVLEAESTGTDLTDIESHIEACASCQKLLDELTDATTRSWLANSVATSPDPLQSAHSAIHFRMVRHHKRGGLGEVFEAWDERLQRPVAVKILRKEHERRPDSRRRFLEEAEITAGLEHPGIVAVHGRADDADLRPWYVMRFVHGETLQDAIDRYHVGAHTARDTSEARLALRGLLNHFVAVCNTVAYAHSRGVIHRDLKPNNIMLGAFGETLVVDWGLAKSTTASANDSVCEETAEKTFTTSSAAAITQAGSAVGTPAFMSPEQAAGRLDAIGTASDVYSLGATLYCLLTGRPPFTGDEREALLHAVENGAFERPRALRRQISPALEAICLTAMALRPEDRYGAAKELADDVQRWLADEPVFAYREPWTGRWRRWIGKHRTLVTAGSIAILVTTVALAATTLLLQASNQRERAAKVKEEQARVTAEQNLVLASNAKALEQAARIDAEHNFNLAREAVEKYFTKVSNSALLKDAALEPLRRELLSQAKDYYEQFLREQGDKPALRADRGSAFLDLGAIQKELGDYVQAERLFREGIRALEALVSDEPTVADYRNRLAHGHELLGVLHVFTSKPKEADADFGRMRSLELGLAAAHPDVVEYQRLAATADMDIGNVAYMGGQMDQAEKDYDSALARLQALPPKQLDDTAGQVILGKAYTNLANMYGDSGRIEKSEAAYRRALGIWQKLAARDPMDPAHRMNLSAAQLNLAGLYLDNDQNDKAEKFYRQALQIEEQLATPPPVLLDYVIALGETYTSLADVFRDREPATALSWYDKAMRTWRTVLAREPRHRTGQLGVENCRVGMLIIQARSDKYAAAGKEAESIAADKDVAPGDLYGLGLAFALCSGAVAADQGLPAPKRHDQAEHYAVRSLDLLRRAFASGYDKRDKLAKDSNLDPIRGRADFKKLVAEITQTKG